MTRGLLRLRWAIPIGIMALTLLGSAFLLMTAPDLVLSIRIDVATLLFIAGVSTALLTLGIGMMRSRSEAHTDELLADVRHQAINEHYRFVRRLDHELKNPLTAIRAGLANMGQSFDRRTYQEQLTELDGQVLRLNHLLRDLRKLAEFETAPLERMQIDVSDLLNEVLSLAEERPEAVERHIRLNLPPTSWQLPLIPGDWDMLFLAIHNVVDNAIKYTLPGNSIEIRAYRDGFTLVIQIADTGPGIPEEELETIWEELARGYSARGVVGSGLGLSLVKIIIARHRGTISVLSQVGHGTIFTIRLPISPR